MLAAMIGFMGCDNNLPQETTNEAVKVRLTKESYGYQLFVDDKPFYVKGAGFEGSDPSSVARYGGNAIRTWRTGDEHITGQQMLDEAHAHG